MKAKIRPKTIDIAFTDRKESIVFLRALGCTTMADYLQAIEDRLNPPPPATPAPETKPDE